MEYENFEIEIDPIAGLEYEVSVRSPAGEARQTMRFPYDKLALESRLKDLQIALLRSGGKRRRMVSPEEHAVQSFGLDLFNALIANEVRTRYDMSQSLVGQNDKGLRLILRIQDPALAALPWEFMYDSRKAEYVSLSRNTPIVRYPEHPHPVQPLRVKPPLHILGLAVSPVDLDRLDIDREKQRLEDAVKRLNGLVTLTWLEGNTWQHLQEAMQRGPWHILHFIGHGCFNERIEEGTIALADEDGRAFELSATKLARLVDHRHLKLVLLNACEGGRSSDADIFSSTASILIRSGIPAVLAMQYEITDTAAIEFSRSFYRAVAQGLPLEGAVVEARKAISIAVSNTVEWGTPVLYLRSSDGRLFNVNLEKDQVDSLYQEVRAAMAKEDWPGALEKIKAILDQQPSHQDAQDAKRATEEQQRLFQLYSEGMEHYYSGRWQKAQEILQSVEAIDRNYKDVPTLLKNVELKLNEGSAETLYSQAAAAMKTENWEQAIKLLEHASQLSPDNQKISDELNRARRQLEFAEVYEEGQALFDAGKWSDALSRFDQLKAQIGEYKDIHVLSHEATQRLSEEQEQQSRRSRLLELRNKAQREMSQERWLSAASLLEAILDLDSSDVEAQEKLKLAKEQVRLDVLYTAVQQAISSEHWRESLEPLRQISSIDPNYKDVVALTARAEHRVRMDSLYTDACAALEKEQFNEARGKLQELINHDERAADRFNYYKSEQRKRYESLLESVGQREKLKQTFEQGKDHYGNGRLQEAFQSFEQVSQIDPGYRNVRHLLETTKRALAEPIPAPSKGIDAQTDETESVEKEKDPDPPTSRWRLLKASAVAIALLVLIFVGFKLFWSPAARSDSPATLTVPTVVGATTLPEPKLTELVSIPTPYEILKVALSPNAEIVAAIGKTRADRWTLKDHQPIGSLPIRTGERGSLVFNPTDSQQLASGSFDGTIRVWNLKEPWLSPKSLRKDAGYVFYLNFSTNGQFLVSGSHQVDSQGLGPKTVTVWQTGDWGTKGSVTIASSETIVALNPDQSLVAISKGTGEGVEVRSLLDNSVRQRLEGENPNKVAYGAFSQDGQTLAVGYEKSSSVFLWSTKDGKLKQHQLKADSGEPNVVAFSPDGQLLAAGWKDGTVLLWRVSDGRLISSSPAHSGAVACIVFSANGQVMASNGADLEIRLWQLSYGN